MAYAEDTKGDEIYTVYVIDIETGAPVGKPLVGITSDLEWAGDEALVYITMDEILRPYKVYDYSGSCDVYMKINFLGMLLLSHKKKKKEEQTTKLLDCNIYDANIIIQRLFLILISR